MIGQRFGRLVVIEQLLPDKYHQSYYLCRCDCGQEKRIRGTYLQRGHSKSCGCLRRELAATRAVTTHGKSYTRTYHSWISMHYRCENASAANYPQYGGRGITVCLQWKSFEVFLADMGEAPKGRTIDRIDNNGNYEPGNCRWATPKEQTLNRSNTRWITYKGETLCLAEWAQRFSINVSTLYRHLKKHSVESLFLKYEQQLVKV